MSKSKHPAWLHPATLRWVAYEVNRSAKSAEATERKLAAELAAAPENKGLETLVKCWSWVVRERRGLRFRLRNIATRVEKRRG